MCGQQTAGLRQEQPPTRRPYGPIAFSVRTADAARSLRHERDHRASDREVIATDGERSFGSDDRRDRKATDAIVSYTTAGAIGMARGCRTIPNGCTKVTTAFWGDLTGARQAAEAELPKPK
jgi:hypothetical protein